MVSIIDPKLKFRSIPSTSNKPDNIIIHHALKKFCSVYDVHNWHLANGWSGIGYHFFISKKGEIFKGREINWVGAHTSQDGMNAKSIGICLEGCYTDYVAGMPYGSDKLDINDENNVIKYGDEVGSVQTDKEVPVAQMNALIDLCRYLMGQYKIIHHDIHPHRKYATYKDCPGKYFPWNEFMRDIQLGWEIRAGIDAINKLATSKRSDGGNYIANPEQWIERLVNGEKLPDWLLWVVLSRLIR